MDKIKKSLMYSFYVVFGICFTFIFINAVFFKETGYSFNTFLLLLGVLGCMGILFFLYHKIVCAKKWRTKLIIGILFFVILVLQIVFAYFFRVKPSWDFGAVYETAVSSAKGECAVSDTWYFYRYHNNYPIAILLKGIFKVASFFHVPSYLPVGIGLNILFIDLAIWMVFLIIKELFGERKACFALILFALMTPIYTYTPIFYTDTISMLFVVLPIYLYLVAKRQEKNKKQILLYVLMGFVIYIGAELKFTVIISLIAILIARLIYQNWKENLKFAVIVIGIVAICMMLQKIAIYHLFDQERLDVEQFPFVHWVMMGLSNKGGYTHADVEYTQQFTTKKEKTEADIQAIKEKLKNYAEKNELFHFFRKKLDFTWSDGTYFAPEKLGREPARPGRYHEYVLNSGTKNKLYFYFSQIIYLSYFAFMLISIFSKYYLNKKEECRMIFSLGMFGVMLFLLIWETRSRYLVNFIPYFVLLSYFGIEQIHQFLEKNQYKRIAS